MTGESLVTFARVNRLFVQFHLYVTTCRLLDNKLSSLVSHGSLVSSLMGQMGHGSQNVTHCLLCCKKNLAPATGFRILRREVRIGVSGLRTQQDPAVEPLMVG